MTCLPKTGIADSAFQLRLAAVTIIGQRDDGRTAWDANGGQQIGKEGLGGVAQADEERLLAGVVVRDRRAQLGDAPRDGLRRRRAGRRSRCALRRTAKQTVDVAPREEFDVDPWMVLVHQTKFAILSRVAARLSDRQLDVEIVLGKIKIWCEKLDRRDRRRSTRWENCGARIASRLGRNRAYAPARLHLRVRTQPAT